MADESKKLSRWYFGGLSSAAAACVTHPLDLLKVFFYITLCLDTLQKSWCLWFNTQIQIESSGSPTNSARRKNISSTFDCRNNSKTRNISFIQWPQCFFTSPTYIFYNKIWGVRGWYIGNFSRCTVPSSS